MLCAAHAQYGHTVKYAPKTQTWRRLSKSVEFLDFTTFTKIAKLIVKKTTDLFLTGQNQFLKKEILVRPMSSQSVNCMDRYTIHPNQFKTTFYPSSTNGMSLCL
jgi:hypothetical protein